jgi:hypothetical protein
LSKSDFSHFRIEREELPHYHSIIAIIIHRVIDTAYDDIIRMGSDTIKSLPAYFDSLANQIPSRNRTPRQQKAFEILWTLAGDNCRPLIGETTDSLWTWYGYMTLEEIATVSEVIREIHNMDEEDVEHGADRALFLAWSRECTRIGKDLFFYAS